MYLLRVLLSYRHTRVPVCTNLCVISLVLIDSAVPSNWPNSIFISASLWHHLLGPTLAYCINVDHQIMDGKDKTSGKDEPKTGKDETKTDKDETKNNNS
jgi:hypothetical protein